VTPRSVLPFDESCDLPTITVSVRESETTDRVVEVLADKSAELYVRGGILVRVASDEADQGGQRIVDVDPTWLRYHIDHLMRWERRELTKDGSWKTKPSSEPKWVAPTICVLLRYPGFRALRGIATSPVIRSDGTLVQANGFDHESRWFVDLPPNMELTLPQKPTSATIKSAKAHLDDLVRDFPFEKECHKGAAMAYLLSLVARTFYDGPAPCFLVSGTTRGSGKDLLVSTLTVVATGQPQQSLTWGGPKNEDETAKKIHALYLAGAPALSWGNVRNGTTFESATFDHLLTSRVWSNRTLGASEMADIPNLAVWSMTGNNLQAGGDLARRIIPILLAPEQEHPEERVLRGLRVYATTHRRSLLAAALTIFLGWYNAGQPKPRNPLGSFEGWSDVVRGAVIWAGWDDPVDGMIDFRESSDESFEDLEVLHQGWFDAFGTERCQVQAVLQRVRDNRSVDMNNAFLHRVRAECLAFDSGDSAMRLGKLLSPHRGRWLKDRRLVKGRTGPIRWWSLQHREIHTREPGEEG
jgi:putative DNA primase/helicase